jgi:hypothetical protein
MSLAVRPRVADIDEGAGASIELLLGLVNLNLRDLHDRHLLDAQLLSSPPASVHEIPRRALMRQAARLL